jgi:hypothetical protein
MLSDALPLVIELPKPPNWERLGAHLPYEWIEQALAHNGKASIRQRRLPAQQVVWLVIALALYRHHSIREVLGDLDLALPDLGSNFVTTSAITQARQRLGDEPLQWLFQTSAKAWSEQDNERYLFHGLTLLAMDGTTLRLADSPANREHFGAQAYANGRVGSYPQARGATLTSLSTHLILDARFGPYKTSEVTFAKEMVDAIPETTLTVFDRGFLGAEVLCGLRANGQDRHFLIPAKSTTKWRVIEGTDEDAVVEMDVSATARRNMPSLPKQWRARAIRIIDRDGDQAYLLTSLMERKLFKAADLVACYDRRWHIETSYRELKQTMMGMALALRSQSVKGVQQEIWGALIAYNLVRLEIAKAALEAKCAPTDISFVLALHMIQYELMCAATMQSQGKLPSLLQRLRQRLVTDLNAHRPERQCARVVKVKAQRYRTRRVMKNQPVVEEQTEKNP